MKCIFAKNKNKKPNSPTILRIIEAGPIAFGP
jgi:hypothetical protein